MTIFIYEHLTSGALVNEPFSASLMHEGDAMITALSHDLLALDQSVSIMRDTRLPDLAAHPLLHVIPVSSTQDYDQSWQDRLKDDEKMLIIAPETDAVLEELVIQLEATNKLHLGSSSSAIRLFSNKLETAQHLHNHGIPTPETMTAENWLINDVHLTDKQWILKPIDGAGCENTFKLNTLTMKQKLVALPERSRYIVQPYIDGEAMSLSVFITNQAITLLSINKQHMAEYADQLSLSHCEPHCNHLITATDATALATKIHESQPGLWGFVGIDLVITSNAVWVIEINPRLTSSYAEQGFREHQNPAQYLLQNIPL